MPSKNPKSRQPIGKIPVVWGSTKHNVLLYLKSNNATPKTIAQLMEMNPRQLKDARRLRELIKGAADDGLVDVLEYDLYRLTDLGNKTLYALAARNRGIKVMAPS